MDITRLKQFVDPFWDDSILPSITEYIRIPNKSPALRSAVGRARPHGATPSS